MKTKLLIALVTIMATSNAFATKARLIALGESKDDGSYYFDDDRRVLINAAHINHHADLLWAEWGANGNALFGTDTDAAPKAEGGFYKKAGSLNYGIVLGVENDTTSLLQHAAGVASSTHKLDNVLQLVVGGDHGVEWGAALLYAKNEDKSTGATKFDSSYKAVRLGVIADKLDAFANISLGNEVNITNATPVRKFDGKLGLHLGAAYEVGDGTAFAAYKKGDWDQTRAAVKSEGGYSEMTVGYGCTHEMADKGRMFYKIAYETVNLELKYTGSTTTEMDRMALPVTIGFEKDATSWLTLRGSVTQNLHSNVEGKNLSNLATDLGAVSGAQVRAALAARYGYSSTGDTFEQTVSNSTNVAAGATLNFGKLRIDGVIGNDGNAGETGLFTLDHLMTRVAATYTF